MNVVFRKEAVRTTFKGGLKFSDNVLLQIIPLKFRFHELDSRIVPFYLVLSLL